MKYYLNISLERPIRTLTPAVVYNGRDMRHGCVNSLNDKRT
jgi:hypothetical protein